MTSFVTVELVIRENVFDVNNFFKVLFYELFLKLVQVWHYFVELSANLTDQIHVRTGASDIFKLIGLVLEMSVVQHMLHFLVKSAYQNLEILAQHNVFILSNVKN